MRPNVQSILYPALLLSFCCPLFPSTHCAQDAVENQAVKALPVIADDPKQIDPAQFLDPKLTAVATISFDDASLDDVAAWLRQQTGWNVVIDAKSFDESGVLALDPIEESLQDLPTYLLLDRLSRYGVIWRVDNSMITFLKTDDQRGIVPTQFHVGDLFDKKVRADDLLDSVKTIDSQYWEESAGGATLLGDVLFVRQYSRTNRRIACLLSALRSPARRTYIDDATANAALRLAVDRLISVDIKQKTLAAVAAELSDLAGISIRVDRPGLKSNRTLERTPISVEVKEQKLRVVMDLLTDQHGLGWHIQDGVVWISSKEVVESSALTAVYDVRDLCRDLAESHALQEAVEQQSDPDSWNGNTGVIQFPLAGVMLVKQTEARHDKILQLLEAYRAALRNSKPRVNEETDPEKVTTRYYRMPTVVAEQLVNVLPELVAAGNWKTAESPNEPGSIRMLASWDQIVQAKQSVRENVAGSTPPVSIPYSVLIISHRRKFQTEIADILKKIENGDAFEGMGGMGGMGGSFGGGMFNVRETESPFAPRK